jgi:sialidase-1
LNRSFDGGNTWESIQIIMDMGEWGGLPQKFNGVSDANILVHGNDIYVAGLWMYGVINKEGKWLEGLNEGSDDWNHQWRNKGSQSGFGEKQTSQFLIVKSSDDGKTWSEPINLTQMCKKEKWWLWAPAPGRGIVMEDGTLVFPTQGRDENGLPFSNITFSKDSGLTWQTSNAASNNTTENSVVEYEEGKLMLNIRDNRNRQDKSETNGRAVFTTLDLGNTWEEHNTSHNALIEPVCMASLHKHVYHKNGFKNEVLLFSNPSSKYQRKNMTIKMSFDGGNTWPENSWILLDEGKGRGYSCITSIDEDTIGIVYEGSGSDLVFQKVDIREFL